MTEYWLSEIFLKLRDFEGERAFGDVLAPWLDADAEENRADLARIAVYDPGQVGAAAPVDLEWLYALSRINDVLLLGLQPPRVPAGCLPWAHELHLEGRHWPGFSEAEYLAVFTALDMTRIEAAGFDPFLHEIVAVEQASDPDAPIEVTGTVWPGLMAGEMLFSREGVTVRAGANHAQAGVADRSPLYSVFLRRHRGTYDLSLGWGSNSQWRTDFRRDYRTAAADHLNVDREVESLAVGDGDDHTSLLTLAEREELLRNRCLLRAPAAPAANADADTFATNLWPYDWRLTLPRGIAWQEGPRPGWY